LLEQEKIHYQSFLTEKNNKMEYEINQIPKLTIEEFQSDFDNLISRVEKGEIFIITHETKNVIIVPYNENQYDEEDEILKVHVNHNDAP